MSQRSGVKIQLEVDEATRHILDAQSKKCNWLYNQLLERANELKVQYTASGGQDEEAARIVYSRRGLRDLVPELKEQHPFLKTVYSSPLKNTGLRLSASIRAYQRWQQGLRPGDEVGWPKYRSWKGKWFSLEYDEPWKGYRLTGRKLQLALGVDREGRRLKVSTRLCSRFGHPRQRVKTLRIVKEHGEFYVVFTIERELPTLCADKLRPIVALDPNHKNLAYGVGTDQRAIEIENLAVLRRLDQRIDELKGKRDRCRRRSKLVRYEREDGSIHRHWEPSRRWRRYNAALERAYRKRREQTKSYLYTVANALCKDYQVIGVGNYTPRVGGITTGMRRSMNNQSLIGRFKRVTTWVSLKSGRLYLEFDEYGTTRTCCCCNATVAGGIAPEVREWTCASCGSSHHRDENAAQNGLRRVKEALVPSSGHVSPVEMVARWTWRVTPTGVETLPGGVTAQFTPMVARAPAR